MLIDSCGAVATLAVGQGERVLAVAETGGRDFSAQWPVALRRLLLEAAWVLAGIQVIGVVNGPGSFTGMRVGMAAAKGLCEAAGARLVTISRLELAQDDTSREVTVISAGRGEWFVSDTDGERTVTTEELKAAVRGRVVRVAGGDGMEALQTAGIAAEPMRFDAEQGLRLLLGRWRCGSFTDAATADANYVRGERGMYAAGKTL